MADPATHNLGFKERFLAATGSSVIAVLLVNPLDVLKTRIQAQQPHTARAWTYSHPTCKISRHFVRVPKNVAALHGCAQAKMQYGIASAFQWAKAAPHSPMSSCACITLDSSHGLGVSSRHWKLPAQKPLSVSTVFRNVVQQEGFKTLWRGADTAILTTVPMVGIYMPLYDYLLGATPHMGAMSAVVAGSTSRMLAAFVVAPLELVRTRQQGLSSGANNAVTAFRSVLQTAQAAVPAASTANGATSAVRAQLAQLAFVPRLWTGFYATLARDVPFSAMYWGMAEPVRRKLLELFTQQQQQELQAAAWGAGPESSSALSKDARGNARLPKDKILLANLIAGSTAGGAAAAITTPFDVVKTRLMVADSLQPLNGWQVMKEVMQRDGLKGLYKGWAPRTARAAPACGIVIASYEVFKSHL